MMLIPCESKDGTLDLWVILLDANVGRIKAYDPAEVNVDKLPPPYKGLPIKSIMICYATDDEAAKVMALIRAGRLKDALRLVSRGWVYRPDQGDDDSQYRSMMDLKKLDS